MLELPTEKLPGLGKPGLYMIGYHIRSGGYPERPAPANFWTGDIPTERLWLLVK